MTTRKLNLLIASALTLVAIVVVLSHQSLQVVWVISFIAVVTLFVLRQVVDTWLQHLDHRNQELVFELLMSGALEAQIRVAQASAQENRERVIMLKRRISDVRDADERAELLQEAIDIEREVDKLLEYFSNNLKSLRESRERVASLRDQLKDLTEERNRLLRQIFFVHRSRESLDKLAKTSERTQQATLRAVAEQR